MSEIPQTPFDIFIYIIVAGGIVAGIFEWIRYFFNKRREEINEMMKHKMNEIAKGMPYYTQLISYYKGVGAELKKDFNSMPKNVYNDTSLNPEVCFYYPCRALYTYNEIHKIIGSIQLDDLESEEICIHLVGKFHRALGSGIGIQNRLRMTSIIQNKDITYSEFDLKVRKKPELYQLYQIFYKWLYQQRKEYLLELSNYCSWFSQLVLFEINHIYRRWYNDEMHFSELDDKFLKYLDSNYPGYHTKIRMR